MELEIAYTVLFVTPGTVETVLEKVKGLPNVADANIILGHIGDLIMKLKFDTINNTNKTFDYLRRIDEITKSSTYLALEYCENSSLKDERTKAYIFIRASPKAKPEILKSIYEIEDYVKIVSMVLGDPDLIVEVTTDDRSALRGIIKTIHSLAGISSTHTCLIL